VERENKHLGVPLPREEGIRARVRRPSGNRPDLTRHTEREHEQAASSAETHGRQNKTVGTTAKSTDTGNDAKSRNRGKPSGGIEGGLGKTKNWPADMPRGRNNEQEHENRGQLRRRKRSRKTVGRVAEKSTGNRSRSTGKHKHEEQCSDLEKTQEKNEGHKPELIFSLRIKQDYNQNTDVTNFHLSFDY
jgi:hypothetical protein